MGASWSQEAFVWARDVGMTEEGKVVQPFLIDAQGCGLQLPLS